MNKKILYTLPLALALAAFAGQSMADSHISGKKTGHDPECKPLAEVKVVNLNLKAQENKINPDCVLAHLGSTLIFKLTPKNDLEIKDVVIEPVDPLDSWLHGSNDYRRGVIIIEIPGDHGESKKDHFYTDHYYRIKVNGETLDPRIQIER